MTVKELKRKLNEFDEEMKIEFLPRISLNGDWNYPKPDNKEDMADIDVYENGSCCTIENNVDYYLN